MDLQRDLAGIDAVLADLCRGRTTDTSVSLYAARPDPALNQDVNGANPSAYASTLDYD